MTAKEKSEIDVKSIPTPVLLAEAKRRREDISRRLGPHAIKRKPRTCKACGRHCPSTRDWRDHECTTPYYFKTVNGKKVIVR